MELKGLVYVSLKKLEHSILRLYMSDLRISPLFHEIRWIKQKLAVGVPCTGQMDQHVITLSKDVLGYVDVLHFSLLKFHREMRETLQNSFILS